MKKNRDKNQRVKHRNYEEIPMAARKRGNIDRHKHEGKKEGMKENTRFCQTLHSYISVVITA